MKTQENVHACMSGQAMIVMPEGQFVTREEWNEVYRDRQGDVRFIRCPYCADESVYDHSRWSGYEWKVN